MKGWQPTWSWKLFNDHVLGGFFLALHFHSFDVISNSFWVFETSFMFNILISKNISERPEHFSIQTCGTCLCNKVAQQYNDCPDTKLCGHDFKKGTFAFLVKSWRIFFFFFYLIAVCLFDIQKCHPVGTKLLSAAGKVAKVSSEVFHFWHSESGRFWYMISFVSAPRSIF